MYRTTIGIHLGGACRFSPSCSEYAINAFRKHNFCNALVLVFKRLIKCRPGGSFGFDPVPICKQGEKNKL